MQSREEGYLDLESWLTCWADGGQNEETAVEERNAAEMSAHVMHLQPSETWQSVPDEHQLS